MTRAVPRHTFSAGVDPRAWMSRLEEMYDPGTVDVLGRLPIRPGWHCLEAGAGGGSIAAWLAARLGPDGSVLAVDRDIDLLRPLATPTLAVRAGDVDTDDLGDAAFDLVHARLLLEHLPDPARTLARLVAAVRPGGWIVLEDMDWGGVHPVPGPGAEVFAAVSRAQARAWAAGGYHADLGYRLPGMLRRLGVREVGCEGRTRLIEGGTAQAAVFIGGILRGLGSWYVRQGWLTEEQVRDGIAWAADPRCAGVSAAVVASWGRRPPTGIDEETESDT